MTLWPSPVRRDRRGYALLAVLWALTFASELAALARVGAKSSLSAAENRVRLARASWAAEGCAERARAIIEGALTPDTTAATAWLELDEIVARSPMSVGCDLNLTPSGMKLGVQADSATLVAFFRTVGLTPPNADSLVAAILDWRDADSTPRLFGAEKGWYERAQRLAPRDGEFASPKELTLVRGFTEALGADSLLTVDDERVFLERAPLVILSTLPGIGADALGEIAQRRARRVKVGDLTAFAQSLPAQARDTLLAHYAELVARTTSAPESWTLTSRVAVPSSRVAASIELRLVRSGSRAAVVSRRTDW